MDGSLCGSKWNSALVLQRRSEFTSVHWTSQGRTEDTLVHKPAGTQPHCKYALEDLFIHNNDPQTHKDKCSCYIIVHAKVFFFNQVCIKISKTSCLCVASVCQGLQVNLFLVHCTALMCVRVHKRPRMTIGLAIFLTLCL